MTNHIVEDAIEVHTPDGIRMIAMPGECSVARVGAMVLHLMDCAGYEPVRSERGAAFAFAPTVCEDEVAETPFDESDQSLIERLQMIPGTRLKDVIGCPGVSYYGTMYDYMENTVYEFKFREKSLERTTGDVYLGATMEEAMDSLAEDTCRSVRRPAGGE